MLARKGQDEDWYPGEHLKRGEGGGEAGEKHSV